MLLSLIFMPNCLILVQKGQLAMAGNRPTKKQIELLRFIDNFIKGNDYSPSYREIMSGVGYKSVSTVAAHVDQLVTKGYLERDTYSPRSLTVVRSSSGEPTQEAAPAVTRRTLEKLHQRLVAAQKIDDAAVIDSVLKLLDRHSAEL